MTGGEEVFKHRQVVAAYNAESARYSECSRMLHWRRYSISTAAASTGAARDLPEITDRLPRKEAIVLSTILFRV